MAEDLDYLVPGALTTVARMTRRYPQLVSKLDPETIQEAIIEATAQLEDMTSRRLTPFTNIIYENMLNGISPDEYGDDSAGMPVDIYGSLGISFANALGASDLVRHFFLDQYAPAYSELWTYDIQSMEIFLTYGNSQPIDFRAGGIVGPEVNSGHCWIRLGTFAPEGTRIKVVYSGGFTGGIPASLQRACLFLAAKNFVIDGTLTMRDGQNMNELNAAIESIMAPWMRY